MNAHPMVKKFGPSAVVLTLCVYCAWQHLEDASPLADMEAGSRSRLKADALFPELPEPVARNMFTTGAAMAEQQRVEQLAATEQPEFDPDKMLGELRLSGTFLHGRQRLAIINGRVLNVGQPIAVDETTGKSCRLVSVRNDGVLVGVDGKTYELRYDSPYRLAAAAGFSPSTTGTSPPTPNSPSRSLFRALMRSTSFGAAQWLQQLPPFLPQFGVER